DAIVEDKPCEVSGEDGYAALELAERIVAEIEKTSGGARPVALTRPPRRRSLILRVSVLRPQPSNFAASSRLPRARRSAVTISVRSNAGRASSSSGGAAVTASWPSAHCARPIVQSAVA